MAVVAVLAALSLLPAGCSSSDSKGGGSSAPEEKIDVGKGMTVAQAGQVAEERLGPIEYATGSTTRGVNGKVITIGGVAEVKAAGGQENYPGICDGARARFERANNEGGANGYTFDYVGCEDTGGSPATAKDEVEEMVEKEEAFAVIPKTTTSGGSGDYLNKEHVPYFGWAIDSDYCGWSDRQFGFAVTGAISCSDVVPGKTFFASRSLDSYIDGVKKDPKDLKWGLIGTNDASAVAAVQAFNTIALSEGSEVAYKTNTVPAAGDPPLADYSPMAQEIVASGANVILMTTGAAPIFALVPALQASGYKGDVVIPFADRRLLAVVDQIDLTYAETPNMGTTVFPSETFDQVTADLEAIGSDAPADGLGTVTSYTGADMFIEALKKVDGPLTTEAFAKVMNSGFEYSQPGNFVCGSSFPASHVVASDCGALVQFLAESKSIKGIADLQRSGKIYLFDSE